MPTSRNALPGVVALAVAAEIGGRIVASVARLIDALHLHWAFSRLVHGLPPHGRLILAKLQVRLGYMHGLALVPEEDLQRSFEAALRLTGTGDNTSNSVYLEFGVYVGTSLACMYRAASRVGTKLRLVGFDSFEGMPEGADAEYDPRWRAGALYSDLELTRRNLARLNVPLERVDLVPGWFEQSLTDETRERYGLERADIVMIDCVIYSSTRVALEFCAPLIKDRTVIYFDDWGTADLAARNLGERAAFEDWLAAHHDLRAVEMESLQFDRNSRVFMVSRSPLSHPAASNEAVSALS